MTYSFPIASFPLLKRRDSFWSREKQAMSKIRLIKTENHFMIKKRIDCEQSVDVFTEETTIFYINEEPLAR